MSGTLKPHTRVQVKIIVILKITNNKSQLSISISLVSGGGLAAYLRSTRALNCVCPLALKNHHTEAKMFASGAFRNKNRTFQNKFSN